MLTIDDALVSKAKSDISLSPWPLSVEFFLSLCQFFDKAE